MSEFSKESIIDNIKNSDQWVINALIRIVENDSCNVLDKLLFEEFYSITKTKNTLAPKSIAFVRHRILKRYIDILFDFANNK